MSDESKCPYSGDARKRTVAGAPSNAAWWPDQLKLNLLHQHSAKADPMGEEFNYAREFKSLDLNAVIQDLKALMTDSQPCKKARMSCPAMKERAATLSPMVRSLDLPPEPVRPGSNSL
jgi:catalase (peroxidase I)